MLITCKRVVLITCKRDVLITCKRVVLKDVTRVVLKDLTRVMQVIMLEKVGCELQGKHARKRGSNQA